MTHTHNTPVVRDNNLDLYRGWVMLYIVVFIHILPSIFINIFYNNTTSTLLLIEMPIVFYISGASYAISRKKSYGEYLKGRFKRIIVPLMIYLFFLATIYAIKKNIHLHTSIFNLASFIFSNYQDFISGFTYNQCHLWFIHVYIIIALLLPLLHYISLHINKIYIYPLLLVIMTVLWFYPNHVLCYLVFTFAGLYYHKEKPYNRIIILVMMIATMLISCSQGVTWNMQLNKFPANIMFLAYTSFAIIILRQPLKWVCINLCKIPFINKIVMIYAQHGYSIYLYHTLAITSIFYIYSHLGSKFPFLFSHYIALPFTMIATTLIMCVVGWLIDKFNNSVIALGSKAWHKTVAIFTHREHPQS